MHELPRGPRRDRYGCVVVNGRPRWVPLSEVPVALGVPGVPAPKKLPMVKERRPSPEELQKFRKRLRDLAGPN